MAPMPFNGIIFMMNIHRDEFRPGETSGDRGRGAAGAEDAHGTLTQSHMSPSILVYEDK